MLNVLLLIVYVGIYVLSIAMIPNRVAVGVTVAFSIVGVLLLIMTVIAPIMSKKRKLAEVLSIDIGKVKRFWFFQFVKLCMTGLLVTQFVRVDMAEINQTYQYSLDTMSIMSSIEDAPEVCYYLEHISIFTPLCVKEYITRRCDEAISEYSTNAFIDTMSKEHDGELDSEAMIAYATTQHELVKMETQSALKQIYQCAVYIVIYLMADLIREILIGREDKRKGDDNEKKKDIFDGVNLMGD